jgi:hypothetical protein
MSAAVGRIPNPATVWSGQTSFRTGSAHRRMATALLAMMIIAILVIVGVSAFRQIAPAGDLPQPSGNAQPAPVPTAETVPIEPPARLDAQRQTPDPARLYRNPPEQKHQ